MAVDFDAYEVLKIDTGVESTEAEVRRAYRKRAIETHPDKNRSRSNAADEFDRVRRAYELLMDKEARAAHDHLIRVKMQRTQRYETMDAKRRKMRDELEAKEKEEWRKRSTEELARERLQVRCKKRKGSTTDHNTRTSRFADCMPCRLARTNLQAELERIRRKMAGTSGEATSTKNADPFDRKDCSQPSPPLSTEANRMLKVAWNLGKGDYTASELKGIFAKDGTVEDVVVKTSKRNRGSALVLMSSAEEIRKASRHGFCGRPDNPLELTPLGDTEGLPTARPQTTPQNDGKDAESLFQSAKLTSNFENKVLARMKEAQARARMADGDAKERGSKQRCT